MTCHTRTPFALDRPHLASLQLRSHVVGFPRFDLAGVPLSIQAQLPWFWKAIKKSPPLQILARTLESEVARTLWFRKTTMKMTRIVCFLS
jgi:hypothetical protein